MHGKAGQLLGCLLQLVVKNEFTQRDGCVRENLDVFAFQVSEMQVRVMQLESLSDGVTILAALKLNEIKKYWCRRRACAKPALGAAPTFDNYRNSRWSVEQAV